MWEIIDLWSIAVLVLLCLSFWSVGTVSLDVCGKFYPIMLSRGFTEDPHRGFVLGFQILTLYGAWCTKSKWIIMGSIAFVCAFLVSMFENDLDRRAC